ncbi:MAG: hypothetical protein ACYDH1_02295 [Anaerolineaceae bacterium]
MRNSQNVIGFHLIQHAIFASWPECKSFLNARMINLPAGQSAIFSLSIQSEIFALLMNAEFAFLIRAEFARV